MTRKPTKPELIALLSWAAHYAGVAEGRHQNDRDPNGFEKGQKVLQELRDRLVGAAGFFPPSDACKSAWVKPIKVPFEQ